MPLFFISFFFLSVFPERKAPNLKQQSAFSYIVDDERLSLSLTHTHTQRERERERFKEKKKKKKKRARDA